MFATIQNEITDRLLSARMFFDAISPPAAVGPAASSREIQVAKGLMFVHLYSVYEHTVEKSFFAGVAAVQGHNLQIKDVRATLLVLGLDPEITAVVMTGQKKLHKKLAMAHRIHCADIFGYSGSFPKDGSHFRATQVEAIWELFGIPHPVLPHPRFTTLIGELVENRNAVAHGRRPADDVGSGYSSADIRRKTDDTQELCLHITTAMQTHCGSAANVSR